ncbi:head GIN domain-containing protein [Flavobacterium psychrotolerans]|uniref:DUF2807 domain-containing protein n=1 Tax=Flavobacterium psychrotolerans TaxID=2169410 RepID=A0A2U1JL75_9FLAO|nr:head GIN domain-containing protein [Flavobacterium psychrotolerans]PWA05921.1 DUF2807 domain-containing protein [Flavobacterium psychrotolerans]
MLKFFILLTKIVVMTAMGLLFASCQFQGIKGSGNVTSENRLIEGTFKSIEVENGLDVVLEQSDKLEVMVVADDNLQKHILTKVKNGVLIITSDYKNYINVKSKKVIVKIPVIESVEVSSAANLSSRNTLKSENISIKSSSGASVKITIEAEKASCESSSGSQITLDGKAINLEISSSSGSTIDAEKLLSNDIIANASSGSSIDVYPLVSLNAEASSGANVNYHNLAKNINKKSSSGGSVNKE